MSHKIGSCWFLIFALFVAPPSAAQSPMDRFERQLQSFVQQLGTKVNLTFERTLRKDVVVEPQQQAVEIVEAARILIDHDGRAQVRTLQELDIPPEVRKEIAAELVKRGLIQRGDLLAEVAWSLGEKKFQTLAAVYPEDWYLRWKRRIFRWTPLIRDGAWPKERKPTSFEPLLFFTPVRVEESPIPADSTGSREGLPLRSLQGPSAPGILTSSLAPSHLLAAGDGDATLWKPEGEPLRLTNVYGTCVTLKWRLQLRTDGCRIFNPQPYTYIWSKDKSFFCPFWDAEYSFIEELYPYPSDSCPPHPKFGMKKEECLKSTLRAHLVLRFPGSRFIRPARPISVPLDVCCHEHSK